MKKKLFSCSTGMMAVACVAFIFPAGAHAQSVATVSKALPTPQDEIVVTGVQFHGSATPLKLSIDPTSDTALVSSLSKEDISRQSLGVNIDIFRSIPGVQVGDFGQVGIAQGVSLRGWPGANDSSALAFYVDGKQWNEGSSTGANGYLDIAPLIPETVGSLTVVKGPFDTRYGGNFALAGSAVLTTVDYLPTGISVSGGSYGNVRVVGTYGVKTANLQYYTTVAGLREDGYQRNANQKQISSFSKITLDTGGGTLSASLATYNIKFGSPGYLPLEGLEDGSVSPRSDIEDTDGGKKNQYTLLTHYTGGSTARGIDITAYAEHEYRNRFATFTPYPQEYTSNNREHYGASVEPHFDFNILGVDTLLLLGTSVRYDDIHLAALPSVKGEVIRGIDPLAAYYHTVDAIQQTQYTGYASVAIKPFDWLKLTGGERYDGFSFNIHAQSYDARADDLVDQHVKTNTGHFSYKGGIAIQPVKAVTLIANVGQSVSSPDAQRNLVGNPDLKSGILTTKEVGVAINPWGGRFHFEGNYYRTVYTNEITFVGQTAINQGESHRRGFDIDASALAVKSDRLTLRLYGNYSYVHARLANGGPIPNVAKWVASYGLHADMRPDSGSADLVRFDIGQQLTGPQPLDNPVTATSSTSARLSSKLSWEMPQRHNLKIWADAIYYTKGRFDEFGFLLADSIYVSTLPKFRWHLGASVDF